MIMTNWLILKKKMKQKMSFKLKGENMELNTVYKAKEVNNVYLRVVSVGENGWCKVIFNHKSPSPRLYNYHAEYIQQFYQQLQEN